MTYSEIEQALKDGEVVRWNNPSYKVSFNSAEGLHIRHLNGSGCPLIYFFGDDPSFYVEDGTPDLTLYKGYFLSYDDIAGEWIVVRPDLVYMGTYSRITSAKEEIDKEL